MGHIDRPEKGRNADTGLPSAYDHPVPDGQDFEFGLIHAGPWLAPALARHGVPPDMAPRGAIARNLIHRLNDDLPAPLAARPPGGVHVDSRGILPTPDMDRDPEACKAKTDNPSKLA